MHRCLCQINLYKSGVKSLSVECLVGERMCNEGVNSPQFRICHVSSDEAKPSQNRSEQLRTGQNIVEFR